MSEDNQQSDKRWLDRPGSVDKIVRTVYAVCALLFLADLAYHKHPHFAAEEWFGFYGVYGFVSCVLLVLAAKELRRLLKRDEGYYDS
jgi:hypothetical protein